MAAAVALALALAGCGSSSLSSTQLRTRAERICTTAERRTDRIASPASPKDAARYLNRGISALTPELAALKTLRPPGDLANQFQSAIAATDAEVRALRSAVRGLKTGDDPVVEIKTLQQKLAPLEAQGNAAWEAVDIRSCASR
jgi:hypothetical protein